MPHPRNRLITQALLKKLKFFPVIAIQGARQTGKSYLVRELLTPFLKKLKYYSLDDEAVKTLITHSARVFLIENQSHAPLVIDEAQKAPNLFDAIKLNIDQEKRPGKFVLLGSTEFSKLTRIKESLTGRMGRVRVFPLTLTETVEGSSKMVNLNALLRYISKGGLPGICFVREDEHRRFLMQEWIDFTCYRDIQQFKNIKLDGDLCKKLLQLASTLSEPTTANFTKETGANPKKVGSHLNALCELFVLQKLNPHPSGTGKSIFLPFDCGLASFFGAPRTRLLQIWIMNERMVYDQCFQTERSQYYYYRSSGKKMIHFLEDSPKSGLRAFQFIDTDRIKKTDLELMKAFLLKNKKSKGYVCAPIAEKHSLNGVVLIPWESAHI